MQHLNNHSIYVKLYILFIYFGKCITHVIVPINYSKSKKKYLLIFLRGNVFLMTDLHEGYFYLTVFKEDFQTRK
jgi:hypothetical protein